jgi:hypothetical protein
MPRRTDRMRDDDDATLRRTISGETDAANAIDADDDDETRFGEPDDGVGVGAGVGDVVGVGDGEDDDFSADTDADTDDDDTDSDTKDDTGTARPVNSPPRRRTLLERVRDWANASGDYNVNSPPRRRTLLEQFTDSSPTASPVDTDNAPLGLTDYKPVYNRLVDAVRNTPNDYKTIAQLFDDFTARLTGEFSEERVEDATRAIVELSSLVFGVVPYPYNSAILADLMELASYAGYVDAQQLFYVWATILDCANLVREYGYDEAIRRSFGVTRRVIQNYSEDQWREIIRLFLKDTGENDGTETEPQQDISAGGSGKTNEADADSIADANSTDIEILDMDIDSVGGQQTPVQATQRTPVDANKKLDELHNDYIASVGNTTEIGRHPKGYISYHKGKHESTSWHFAPTYPDALAEIERHLGHPMLLGGLLTVAGGFPAYLETRAGYGKTTMARALDERIDSLYQRLGKDQKAARELAEFPFADVIIVEPKHDVAELIGMMTGGSISGTTAIAPTAEIRTALERATRWRMPNGRMAKPVLFVYDNAHTPAFLRMIEARLRTSLASNTMYGMPYLTATHLLFANPNQENISSELASLMMPWITPADVTVEYGMREIPTVSEFIQAAGRKIAKAALRKVLGQSIDEIGDISKVLNDKNVVQKLREQFDEEIRERPADYGVLPRHEEELRQLPPEAYLTGGLGMPHYMDAIATSVSEAGLDAVTAGWHWRPDDEVDVDNIYSQYAGTTGFKAAYTPEELKEVAERHAAFANAVQWNESMAITLATDPSTLPEWKKVKDFIDRHLSSQGEKINWYNERSAMNRRDTIEAGPDRSPRDWQRFVSLSALFGAMGRPDMVAYTIGAIGGINPEVPMPDLTVNDTPAEIDRKLDRYFNAENLSPSVQAMLQGQELTPEEYAEGLKQYARAVIFTTQTDGGA